MKVILSVDGPLDPETTLARYRIVRDAAVDEVRRIFGLDFDLPGFYRMAKGDPALAPLAAALYGFRPTLTPTPLEMLVGAITAQQVNLAFAFALRASLVRRFGTAVAFDGDTVFAFPEARVLARGPRRAYRAMKFSTHKGE